MPRLSSKNQITIPVREVRAAGLVPGDEVEVKSIAIGELKIAVRGSRVRRHAGICDGITSLDELERLRREWRD